MGKKVNRRKALNNSHLEQNKTSLILFEALAMAPQLRGLLQKQLFKDLYTALAIGLVAGAAWRYGYAEPKKNKMLAYYKDFDADKAAKELEEALAAAGKE